MASSSVVLPSIELPLASTKGNVSVEEAMARRRSIRHYSQKPLTLESLSQILWASQGITQQDGEFRTTPSAGALYPLEVYVVVGKAGVETLPEGVYHYRPKGHLLATVKEGDVSADLEDATWGQDIVKEAAATIVITGVLSRMTEKYGRRGTQYMFQESGHVAQNIFLQATALGIGTVAMGAFGEAAVRRVLGAEADERPLYVQPLGKTA